MFWLRKTYPRVIIIGHYDVDNAITERLRHQPPTRQSNLVNRDDRTRGVERMCCSVSFLRGAQFSGFLWRGRLLCLTIMGNSHSARNDFVSTIHNLDAVCVGIIMIIIRYLLSRLNPWKPSSKAYQYKRINRS